jgi:hypothetical protein
MVRVLHTYTYSKTDTVTVLQEKLGANYTTRYYTYYCMISASVHPRSIGVFRIRRHHTRRYYHYYGLTINVPVVYMGWYEVVLRGDYP